MVLFEAEMATARYMVQHEPTGRRIVPACIALLLDVLSEGKEVYESAMRLAPPVFACVSSNQLLVNWFRG